MKCPKCQFDNIAGSKFCKECGNKLELVCPKCGFRQTHAEECAKCGIVFNKLKKQQPLASEIKRYKVKLTFLLFIKCLIAGSFMLAGFLIYWRNSVPGGIEAVVAISILCIICGIVFIFLHIQEKLYFVSLSEKGINIANKKIIPWEDINNVEWNEKYYRGIPNQWIDIYTADQVKQKIVNIRIAHKIENIEDLYQEIKKRLNSDIEHLRTKSDTDSDTDGDTNGDTDTRMQEKFIAGMVSLIIGFLLIVLSLSPEGGKELILVQKYPRLALMIGIIFFITGAIIIIIIWRNKRGQSYNLLSSKK